MPEQPKMPKFPHEISGGGSKRQTFSQKFRSMWAVLLRKEGRVEETHATENDGEMIIRVFSSSGRSYVALPSCEHQPQPALPRPAYPKARSHESHSPSCRRDLLSQSVSASRRAPRDCGCVTPDAAKFLRNLAISAPSSSLGKKIVFVLLIDGSRFFPPISSYLALSHTSPSSSFQPYGAIQTLQG